MVPTGRKEHFRRRASTFYATVDADEVSPCCPLSIVHSPVMPSPIPISTENAPHYEWGSGCDGWHLVKAQSFSVIAERMQSGTEEVRHWHARARQFFYVLEGQLDLEVEGAKHVLTRGVGLEIPPGLAHQARNTSGAATDFLVISSPPHQGDRKETDPGA